MKGIDLILKLQREIRRNHQSRYDHRLHAVLLVMSGMSCMEAGRLLGDSPRALQYWVKRFEEEGLAGLKEKEKPGRPSRLPVELMTKLERIVQGKPSDYGFDGERWSAKFLSEYISRSYGVNLSLRQCQRLLSPNGPLARRLPIGAGMLAQYIMASFAFHLFCFC